MSGRSGWYSLGVASLAQAAIYACFFLVPFWHLWGTLPEPTPPGSPGPSGTVLEGLMTAVLFGVPSVLPFLWLVRMQPVALRPTLVVLALLILPALVALLTYPCCGGDAIDYVNRQRLWAVYGDNPLFAVADNHPEDWTYPLTHQRDLPAPYGPVWWLLGRAATSWASSLAEYFVGFKLLAAVCFGASLALIWRLSTPERRVANAAFFAWNPIVVIDGLVRFHNDLLPLPWLLLGVWLWRQKRESAAIGAIALAALAKVIVAPAGLVVAAAMARARGWRALAVGIGLALGVIVVLYAPFWAGQPTFGALLPPSDLAGWSLASGLVLVLHPALADLALPLVRVVLAGACAWLVLGALRLSAAAPVEAVVRVALATTVLIPLVLYSHYLIPIVGLAALTSDVRLRRIVLALGIALQVNNVLGVDALLGGLKGEALGVAGCLVIAAGLVGGLAWSRPWAHISAARPAPLAARTGRPWRA